MPEPSYRFNYVSPQLGGDQYGATTGRRTDKRKVLGAYLQSQIPAMRTATEYQRGLAERQEEQALLSGRHEEEMALEKERLAANVAAQEEASNLARARLGLERDLQKQKEKYSKYGLALQGVGLGLQAWDTYSRSQRDTGYGSGGEYGGGSGPYAWSNQDSYGGGWSWEW